MASCRAVYSSVVPSARIRFAASTIVNRFSATGAIGTRSLTPFENVTSPIRFARSTLSSIRSVPSLACVSFLPAIEPDVSTTSVTTPGFLTVPHDPTIVRAAAGSIRSGLSVAVGLLASGQNRLPAGLTYGIAVPGRNPSCMNACCRGSSSRYSIHCCAASVWSGVTQSAFTTAAEWLCCGDPSFG